MIRTRRRGLIDGEFQRIYSDLGYTIPAGFMTLDTVGPDAADAPNGPKTRQQLPSIANYVNVTNQGQSLALTWYQSSLQIAAGNTTMTQIYVDDSSKPPTNVATVAVAVQAGQNYIILANLDGSSNVPFTQATAAQLLYVQSVQLNVPQNSDTVYIGCSGLDGNNAPIYEAPTQVSNGWQYQIYNPSTSDNTFANPHSSGRTVEIPGQTGYSLQSENDKTSTTPMFMTAYFCQFGNREGNTSSPSVAGAGGGFYAVPSTQKAYFHRCGASFNGDSLRITSEMWFDRCIIGPNLAPATQPGYHSDGFQNSSAVKNTATGSTWFILGQQTDSGGYSGSMGYSASKPSGAGDYIKLFGQTWSLAYKSSLIGIRYSPSDNTKFEYTHSPMFLPSNTARNGVVQNFLVDSCFIMGGQSMLLDTTPVNSIGTADNSDGTANSYGGVHGVILRRNCIDFTLPTPLSTQATITVQANAGDTTVITDVPLDFNATYQIVNPSNQSEQILTTYDSQPAGDLNQYFGTAITTDVNDSTSSVGLANNYPPGSVIQNLTLANPNNNNAPNTSKTYNAGAGATGQILTTTTWNYNLNADLTASTATTMQLTLSQPSAITVIPPGEQLTIEDPAIHGGKADTSETVICVAPSSYDSNSGIITVPITPPLNSHSAVQVANVKSNDITNWVELDPNDSSLYSSDSPNQIDYSLLSASLNYWELSNYRRDRQANNSDYVITLAQAQWTVAQWLAYQPYSAPTANAGPNASAAATAQVTLDGIASSTATSNLLLYSWRQISGPHVSLSYTNAVRPTFSAGSAASGHSCVFGLTVTDTATKLISSEDTVTIALT